MVAQARSTLPVVAHQHDQSSPGPFFVSGPLLSVVTSCLYISQRFPITVKRVVQGGSLARFTDEKNNESRITDIEISFSRITKISTLILSCCYATNSV